MWTIFNQWKLVINEEWTKQFFIEIGNVSIDRTILVTANT